MLYNDVLSQQILCQSTIQTVYVLTFCCTCYADLEVIPVPDDDLGSTGTQNSLLDLPEIPSFDF